MSDLNIGIDSYWAASKENPATAKEKWQTKKLAAPEMLQLHLKMPCDYFSLIVSRRFYLVSMCKILG